MSQFREILLKYWGYDTFRYPQEEIIKSVSEGKDTLGLMPTGGGKSITFQVFSMANSGVCHTENLECYGFSRFSVWLTAVCALSLLR